MTLWERFVYQKWLVKKHVSTTNLSLAYESSSLENLALALMQMWTMVITPAPSIVTCYWQILKRQTHHQSCFSSLHLIDKIVGKYGKVHCFPGALSTHWTTDNNTHTTRVSLDFRIIPGSLYDSLKCGGSVPGGKKDVYRAKKGYYNLCCKTTDGVWIRKQALHSPLGDPRFGYPWTRSSTKSSGVQVVHPQRP